ncbi:hypothetical protein CCAX7_53820 [Capsulimonas corticalis]|uniref:Uncharacterized protein n=1 Tax=Capsulimonas corticalis TaxID=2219043 RepID=A0A402CNC5_9BACT|nr:hypothetical protein [Capsulimonas corticalis]BDI33331.1 hypothetical protein CCAX7_53820 [Capsulimonas corticalis]
MGLFNFVSDVLGGGDHGAAGYGAQAGNYQGLSDLATEHVGDQIAQYGKIANEGQSEYNMYDPGYNAAIAARAQRLQQNPFTQQSQDAYLANRIGPTTAAYNTARANMATNAYTRGLDTPSSGGASSVYAGNDAYLQNGQLGRLNAADNSYADWANQEQNNRETQLLSLLGGARDQGLNQWQSGLGSEASGNEWTAGKYGEDAQRYYGLQQQAEQQQANDTSATLGLIGQAGSLFGSGGAFGKHAKAAPGAFSGTGSLGRYTGNNGQLNLNLGLGSYTPTGLNYEPFLGIGG